MPPSNKIYFRRMQNWKKSKYDKITIFIVTVRLVVVKLIKFVDVNMTYLGLNDKIGVSSSEMWSFVCIRTSGLSNRDSNLESNRQWGIDCLIGLVGYSFLAIGLSLSNSPGDDGSMIGWRSADVPGFIDMTSDFPWVYWIFFIWPYWFEPSFNRFSDRCDERKRQIMKPNRTSNGFQRTILTWIGKYQKFRG